MGLLLLTSNARIELTSGCFQVMLQQELEPSLYYKLAVRRENHAAAYPGLPGHQ